MSISMPISWQMSTAITVCEYEPEEFLSIVRQAEVLYGQGMAMPVALAADEPILVPQRIKGPLRVNVPSARDGFVRSRRF